MRIRALIKLLQQVEARHGDVEVSGPHGVFYRMTPYNKDGTCSFAHADRGPVHGVMVE